MRLEEVFCGWLGKKLSRKKVLECFDCRMPPKKKSGTRTAASIAKDSTASVTGYLHNVANRVRVPRAEGNKGTRRKVGMVSSHPHPTTVVVGKESTAKEAGDDTKNLTADDSSPVVKGEIANISHDSGVQPSPTIKWIPEENIISEQDGVSTKGEKVDHEIIFGINDNDEDEWDEIVIPTSIHATDSCGANNNRVTPALKRERAGEPLSFSNSETAVFPFVPRVKQERSENEEGNEDGSSLCITTDMPSLFSCEKNVTLQEDKFTSEINAPSTEHLSTFSPGVKGEESEGISNGTSIVPLNHNSAVSASVSSSMSSSFLSNALEMKRNGEAPVPSSSNGVAQKQWPSSWYQRDDPAYDEMRDRRDQLIARRRSERMNKVFLTVVKLLFLLFRGQWLWREVRRPSFLKDVLQVRQVKMNDCAFAVEKNPLIDVETSGRQNGSEESSSCHTLDALPFVTAVKACRTSVRASFDPSNLKPSLAPAWVTVDQDGVKNHTSAAVTLLLKALSRCFQIATPQPDEIEITEDKKNVENRSEEVMKGEKPLQSTGGEGSSSTGINESASKWNAQPAFIHDMHSSNPDCQSAPLVSTFSSCTIPLQKGYLPRIVHEAGNGSATFSTPHVLRHPVYMCLLLLSLAAVAGIDARLVMAVKETSISALTGAPHATTSVEEKDSKNEDDAPFQSTEEKEPLEKLSIFSKKKFQRVSAAASSSSLATTPSEGTETSPTVTVPRKENKKKPTSCFWVEVWSPERLSYFSVNPCQKITTLWGAPYVFAFSKGSAVDVTARYTSLLSKSYLFFQRLGKCTNYRFLWNDKIAWDDAREVSDVLIQHVSTMPKSEEPIGEGSNTVFTSPALPHSSSKSPLLRRKQQIEREGRQLESLRYSETIPNTLSRLHRHPLFVIESDLSRMEGIYPKDRLHTVGSVKGHTVYKRSAVQNLRSRDGWIRERRSLIHGDEEVPYKVVPPPVSRPFASPSHLFGHWQTIPFTPQPLTADKKLPLHGNSKWYVLLQGHEPPNGIVHRKEPHIAKVARKMQLDFRLAVVGFEHKKIHENRRGNWFPIIEGIIIQQHDNSSLLKAYTRWVQLMEEQAAAKRRERSMQWWKLFYQRLLAMDRMQRMYQKGSSFSFPQV